MGGHGRLSNEQAVQNHLRKGLIGLGIFVRMSHAVPAGGGREVHVGCFAAFGFYGESNERFRRGGPG